MQKNKQTNKKAETFNGKDGYSPACHYVSPRGICAGQSVSETDNSQGSFVLLFQYHSITASYSFTHT